MVPDRGVGLARVALLDAAKAAPHGRHQLRQTTWPEIDQHRDFIVAMPRALVNRRTIWQRAA
ncbi:hypothetical protein [Mycobacterium riyadhense]|uniref:Uncharacterized protein n=1 Tax=Mycobacterium riyadhense TaxID=486698 RepID=A0A1X2CM24_9MYCO|nr:hypothetical protein AWC22_21050 [Mycobacterium riyadhense]